MNLFEMKKDKQAALDAAEAVLERAEKAGRDLNAQETALFDTHMNTAKQLSAKIKPIEEKNTIFSINPAALLGGGVRDNGAFECWKDERGHAVPVLKNNQSFASAVQTGPAPNFGFGDFVKNLVSPNPDIQAALSEAGGLGGG
jgi:hypothetical protein